MKRTFLAVAMFALSLGALADTWGDAEAWVYKPKYSNYLVEDYVTWIATDSKGNTAKIYYQNNSDGTVDERSLELAMSQLKLSVSSVFQNMAYLAQDLVAVNANLAAMDAELADLDAKLDNAFAQVFGKLNTLESQESQPTDEGGVTATDFPTEYKIVEKTTEKIVVSGGLGALKVDGKSIGVKNEGTADACYQLKNYPSLLNGYIPISTESLGLVWQKPKPWFDASTIDCDVNLHNIPVVSDDKHGIHLAGWYNPTGSGHYCEDDLSTLLETGSDNHYVVTQNKVSGELHYTNIGKFAGGYAIKFVGTAGTPVVLGAPSAKTNTVTFASAADSNVSVTIGGSSSAVTVTIGVYYK